MSAGTIKIKYKMDENDALISRRQAVSRMSDLICLELKGKCPTWNDVYTAMNELPTVEFPERKKGHWDIDSLTKHAVCPFCRCPPPINAFEEEPYLSDFCPDCGADLR